MYVHYVLDTVIVTALCARSSYLDQQSRVSQRRPVTGSKTESGRGTIKRLRFRRRNRQGRVGASRQMHPWLHKLAVSFTCRPLENGTSRHVEHECTLVRPVVTMRLLQYTDNADFRNAVGKGGRERWIDRRVKPSLADPPPRGLGSETEMLEKKKGGERGCDKKGLRRRDYLRRMIDRLS